MCGLVTNGVFILRQAKAPLGKGTLNSELAAGRLRLITARRNCDSNQGEETDRKLVMLLSTLKLQKASISESELCLGLPMSGPTHSFAARKGSVGESLVSS